MSFSLNEVEAIAKRAAKGAGYSWGLAEEAAKATRWLCSAGIDGIALLVQTLNAGFAAELRRHSADVIEDAWCSEGALCPLMTGSMVSDHAANLKHAPLTLINVAVPLFLLPFAAQSAMQLDAAIALDIDGHTLRTDGKTCEHPGAGPDHAKEVVICISKTPPKAIPEHTRATPSAQTWAELNSFAHRTYAPATEASRLLGAGSGLSDND